MKLSLSILATSVLLSFGASAQYGNCYYDGSCNGSACCEGGECVYCAATKTPKTAEQLQIRQSLDVTHPGKSELCTADTVTTK